MAQTPIFTMRFTPELRAVITDMAKSEGRSLASMIERLLWSAIEQQRGTESGADSGGKVVPRPTAV